MNKSFVTAIAAATVALSVSQASAVGTRSFKISGSDQFKEGDLVGVAVDSTGKLRAGWDLGSTAVSEGTTIWSALRTADGGVLLATGNEGKLLKANGAKVEVAATSKALALTSLAEAWGGSVVVGSLPEGKVYRWQQGKLSELVSLEGTEHVWQVAFDKKTNSVYAATGPEGKLWRITQGGQAQVYFDAEEQHLMSVAVAPDGTVYAGASEEAKLYKITGPGRASVLHDFGTTEVRAIALGAKGEVYAIANEISGGSKSGYSGKSGQTPAEPESSGSNVKGKGSLYRFGPSGEPEQLLEDGSEHFVSLAIGADGQPYVGTGAEGRIYTVDAKHRSTLVADTEERQVTALLLGGTAQYVAGSDPAVLHPLRGSGGPDAVWTSSALDAGLRARFGRVTWDMEGTVEFSTRTGNTAKPDDTWSDWSQPFTTPTVVTSPPARYLQIRARFNKGGGVELRELNIPFLTDNLRALITNVEASSQASGEGTKAGVQASGGPISKKPETSVNLKWTVDNPDQDELRYRLRYRLLGTNDWYPVLKPQEILTSENYSWDTSNLPEGRYRIEVTATDELANPPDRVKRHVLESGIVLVDNTAPTLEQLTVNGRSIRGVALDGVGPIQRIEVSVAGAEEWYPFYPSDGIFDEQREEFELDVSSLVTDVPALLTVKVYDTANNVALRHVTVR